jgi:hypothetical protein
MLDHAIAIATGIAAIADDIAPLRIKGAWNDYNARGRGHTTARRVLRDGKWEWLSAPASRGRMRAADRNDMQYGNVWEGEIIAEHIIGARSCEPEQFYLIVCGEDEKLINNELTILKHHARRDGQFAVTLPDDQTITVSNPAWR